jgi:hypothetical protein
MELLFRPGYKSFIRYKFSYVDLRALTTASTVLGFTSYLSLYYAIFVSLRALTGGLKYSIAMMAVPILGLLQLITWSSGPGTGAKSFYYPVYTTLYQNQRRTLQQGDARQALLTLSL